MLTAAYIYLNIGKPIYLGIYSGQCQPPSTSWQAHCGR